MGKTIFALLLSVISFNILYAQTSQSSFEDRMNDYTSEQRNMFNIQNNSYFPASQANYDPKYPKYYRGMSQEETKKLYEETDTTFDWVWPLIKGLGMVSLIIFLLLCVLSSIAGRSRY